MKHAMKMVLGLLCLAVSAQGGFIYTETWDATDAGWTAGSDYSMAVSYSLTMGALMGTFGAQDIPSPETGSFFADSSASGGAFTGNYWADSGNFYGWTVKFYAEDILPSSLYIRFGDGENTYQANLLGQVSGVGNWYTLSTPALTFGLGGWLGGGGIGGLSNALASVEWLELRVGSNQEDEQTFYVDNFQQSTNKPTSGGGGPTGNDGPGGGEGPSGGGGNVPEPGTLAMGLGLAGLSLSKWGRRQLAHWRSRKAGSGGVGPTA